MIQAFESYNKISTKLKISHSKAKELVNQYFNHDVSKITEYEMRVKELLRSNMSEIRKTHKRKPRTIYEMLTSSKILKTLLYDEKNIVYLKEVCVFLESKNITPNKKYFKFIYDQITHYGSNENKIKGFMLWSEIHGNLHNMNKEYWVLRFGPSKGEIMYAERLKKCNIYLNKNEDEKNKCLVNIRKGSKEYVNRLTKLEKQQKNPRSVEFYLKRGYSEVEAKEIIKNITKDLRSRTGWGNGNTNIPKENLQTCVEYWIKNYGEEEGRIRYKERQTTFSLSKCKEKYGEEEGMIKFLERQSKWQKTLKSKPASELQMINVKKCVAFAKASKASLILFDDLINQILSRTNIKREQIYVGKDETKEYFICENKKIYFYDFCIPHLNLIIEFHGLGFHYDEKTNIIPNNFFNLDIDEIKNKDRVKKSIAESNGFEYYVVWQNKEEVYDEHVEKLLERIISLNRRG